MNHVCADRYLRLLFSNPTWIGGTKTPGEILRNITALSSQIAYSERIEQNITTLSPRYVQSGSDGIVQGLLYVPDLDRTDPCQAQSSLILPTNVTRQANLPQTSYNLIAIAPWISANCSLSFLASARLDPLRALIFYLPDGSTDQPPPASDPIWEIDGGDTWKANNHFPVYAIPGANGAEIVYQLSRYSGDLTEVPYGANISALYNPDPKDYVRIWTALKVNNDSSLPGMWVFALIIVAMVLFIIGSTSLLMHYFQRRRRTSLRRRVINGEIDLETSGIKRVPVPMEHIIQQFPLFTYNYDPLLNPPASPSSGVTLGPPSQHPSDAITKASDVFFDKNSHPTNYQPVCHICLEEFESKVTIIRELSCGHIFHSDCIDVFLSEISSLCPICKKSMLLKGYCPKITNGMVRRELATRRLRPRHVMTDDEEEMTRSRLYSWGASVKKRLQKENSSPPPSAHLELSERARTTGDTTGADNAHVARQRMRELAVPIDEINSDDGRPQWRRAVTKVFPGFT